MWLEAYIEAVSIATVEQLQLEQTDTQARTHACTHTRTHTRTHTVSFTVSLVRLRIEA